MKLYKYTNIDYAIKALEYGIYAGRLNQLNDPYEGEGILYPESYRICSLTSSSKAMLMWAYYGYHRECCIGYHIADEHVRKVIYTSDYYDHIDMTNEELIENLYCKAKEWSHENEYRIICHTSQYDPSLWFNNEENYYFKARPFEITFGLNTNFKEERVQKLLNYLLVYEDQLKVNKCRLSHKKYEIVYHKQFDFKKEITK